MAALLHSGKAGDIIDARISPTPLESVADALKRKIAAQERNSTGAGHLVEFEDPVFALGLLVGSTIHLPKEQSGQLTELYLNYLRMPPADSLSAVRTTPFVDQSNPDVLRQLILRHAEDMRPALEILEQIALESESWAEWANQTRSQLLAKLAELLPQVTPSENSLPDSGNSEPTSGGKTRLQWLAVMQTERDSAFLLKAIDAIERLEGPGQHTVESANAMLAALDNYPLQSLDSVGEDVEYLRLWVSVHSYLSTVPLGELEPVLKNCVLNGKPGGRVSIFFFLGTAQNMSQWKASSQEEQEVAEVCQSLRQAAWNAYEKGMQNAHKAGMDRAERKWLLVFSLLGRNALDADDDDTADMISACRELCEGEKLDKLLDAVLFESICRLGEANTAEVQKLGHAIRDVARDHAASDAETGTKMLSPNRSVLVALLTACDSLSDEQLASIGDALLEVLTDRNGLMAFARSAQDSSAMRMETVAQVLSGLMVRVPQTRERAAAKVSEILAALESENSQKPREKQMFLEMLELLRGEHP